MMSSELYSNCDISISKHSTISAEPTSPGGAAAWPPLSLSGTAAPRPLRGVCLGSDQQVASDLS